MPPVGSGGQPVGATTVHPFDLQETRAPRGPRGGYLTQAIAQLTG
jgi:hypothetical protein